MAANLGMSSANPYLDDTVDATLGDITRNFNLTTQPAFNAAMNRSGSFGNTGVQEMNGEAQRQLQTSLGRAAGDLRNNDYQFNQQLNRGLYNDAFAQNQQGFQNGLSLIGTLNGFNQQDLTNATTVQNTPLNYYQQFANTATGIGNGFGTETKALNGQSDPVTAALGGAQLGAKASNYFGWGGTAPISQENQQGLENLGASNNWWGTG